MKRILLPVEDMNISEKVLALTIEFGQSFDSEIVLLHVQPINESLSYPYAPLIEPFDNDALNQISDRIINNASNLFTASGLTVSTRIVSGNPASEIIECAGEENCDMIIMSTHGMGKIKRFLLGSVTNNVVIHSKIPVLVVR